LLDCSEFGNFVITLIEYQYQFRYRFIIILKLNKKKIQIFLQDKYNIGVLTVHIECMWLGTKRVERLYKARCFPVTMHRHIHYMFTVNAPILYMYWHFQQNQCLNIKKTCRTQHTKISMGPL
jgi:hypothetical protein